MKQKILMKKNCIKDWNEFKDRRFLGWKRAQTKQLFLNPKGMGIWHRNQRRLCSKK